MIIVVVFDGDTAFVDHPLLGIAAQKTKGIMVADNPLYGQIFGINLVGAFASMSVPLFGVRLYSAI